MSKPDGKHDAKWCFWRGCQGGSDKFSRYDKKSMNRLRRRVGKIMLKGGK